MSTTETRALILRTVDYGENHVIVDLLGRSTGRVSAIAHGAKKSRKRFGGALQPLRVVAATMTSRSNSDLWRLDELEVCDGFDGIDERIETITAASYATELVRETWREGESAAPIFELLRRFYAGLPRCKSTDDIRHFIHHFEFQLLALYGLAPAIDGCARCGSPASQAPAEAPLRFSRRGEGLVCDRCRHTGDATGLVAQTTVAVLKNLADPDQPLPDEDRAAAIAQAGRILSNAIDQLVDRPLKSRPMLHQLL